MRYDPIENVFDLTSHDVNDRPLLPFFVWHITNRCRLKCPYCFTLKDTQCVHMDLVPLVLRKAQDLGVLKIDVSGGEPLLHGRLAELLDAIAKTGIPYTLTTSGTGPRSAISEVLERIPAMSRLIVSIDGPWPRVHDALRGRNSLRAAQSLIEQVPPNQRRNRLRINTVVSRAFLRERCLEDMVDLIENMGVREWCLIETHPANAKPDFSKHAVSTVEHKAVVTAAKQLTSKVIVISRSAELYSDYWVLHPSGQLVQHTRNGKPGINIDLLQSEIAVIKEHISHARNGLPTRE